MLKIIKEENQNPIGFSNLHDDDFLFFNFLINKEEVNNSYNILVTKNKKIHFVRDCENEKSIFYGMNTIFQNSFNVKYLLNLQRGNVCKYMLNKDWERVSLHLDDVCFFKPLRIAFLQEKEKLKEKLKELKKNKSSITEKISDVKVYLEL